MMKLERDELATRAQEFVSEIVRRAQLDLDLDAELDEEGIRIEFSGEDSGILLSENARLLYALNHLVNQIFYRQSKDGCNFLLDCSDYRQQRTAELELMAQKAAEKARSSGIKVSLQPMPSSERRIIHIRLAEESGVQTESEGSGRYRRVLIVPTR